MPRVLWLALLALLGWGALNWWQQRPLHPPSGVLAADAPEQVDLDEGAVLQRDDVSLRTLAHIALTARVLSREDYRWDAGASLAPMDLALGWGRMSGNAVLARMEIDQSARFYHWHVDTFPIPRREIERSSANMHLIPANTGVRRAMERVRRGELVHIEGFLVDASRPDGWHWRSSLTRDDTGDGACELVYVEALDPVTP
ncbi:hypothetical protein [Frateuria terrea]|uniref:Uncharacterized protein n=1 Tax=Frateuria terrea TaxID=529704 RepID=A0A1H6Z2Z6_9GAMM|nr:hypothetical protein [Frateuria terrea]SEJ43305.1 hypothetical protein SAMN04487997_3351 [Frateuria terrea]SFP72626.1 hypothetical protein SAMN02927913_3332 [Frateuria terrea]